MVRSNRIRYNHGFARQVSLSGGVVMKDAIDPLRTYGLSYIHIVREELALPCLDLIVLKPSVAVMTLMWSFVRIK